MTRQKNYTFGLLKLEYLDHVMFKDGLKADHTKCKAIQEWSQPTNVKELQSFLGMAN